MDRGKIPDETIPWLKNYLGFAVESLRALLRDEAKQRWVVAHGAVMEAWRPLLYITGVKNLKRALLQKAVEITDAENGWLLTAVEGTEQGLEVRAIVGTQKQRVRSAIPPSVKDCTTVDAWTTGSIIVAPWFRKSDRFLELRAGKVWEILAQTSADGPRFQR